ncbi:MAG: hypothetical protein AMJ55_11245 [Gammaproteobacteria bacterium SG8_15]|nr:MAG: hypothetical protein AMJ55_11245 [Gammaproteobacteria bacterium SG8_15]
MKKYFSLVLLSGLVVLAGCELDSPDDTPYLGPSIVNSFNVFGNTVDMDERIVLPLLPNNAIVTGDFDLQWDVTSSDPYMIEVYISSNSVLDPIDTLFLQMQCGSNGFQFTCDQLGDIPCVIAYEPDYEMTELRDENNEIVVDVNGDPIMVAAKDPATGYFIVLDDRYYLRCANGPATVRIAEITDRVELNGFPFINYLIFKACATDELLCYSSPVSE